GLARFHGREDAIVDVNHTALGEFPLPVRLGGDETDRRQDDDREQGDREPTKEGEREGGEEHATQDCTDAKHSPHRARAVFTHASRGAHSTGSPKPRATTRRWISLVP